MRQPELGKKIAELRKAKGLTQEELVDKCNLTVRTLQRIESGVVTPRSYTLKVLFATLDYNTYDFSQSDSEKRVFPFFKVITEQFYESVSDIFNLKTNRMKKISILSATAITLSIGLFLLCSKSNAQKLDLNKFTESKGRGIIYLFPRGLSVHISNTKDTADYKIGKYLIQENKYKIFLNKKFAGRVFEGDTVVLNKGKITIRKSYWEFHSSPDNGIVYYIPDNLKMNYSHRIDTNNMIVGDFRIKEYNNKIYLNGAYMGIANKNDTVILKNGSIIIR
jgi:transcriptional regulator with XRE-family HTH domain